MRTRGAAPCISAAMMSRQRALEAMRSSQGEELGRLTSKVFRALDCVSRHEKPAAPHLRLI